ncbi:hypothetical protein [Aeromonas dhakensis]|uniref:hypothetical protein n=1 Tax=Aeromonas dhakensis TaxID=196024 RepID=UPI003EC4A70B
MSAIGKFIPKSGAECRLERSMWQNDRFHIANESEHFSFCSRLHCQRLNIAICCERIGIVAEKNQSGAECRVGTYAEGGYKVVLLNPLVINILF